MLIADMLMPHTVILESLIGSGATGAKYGPPSTVRAFVNDTQEMVRNSAGQEVVSSTTVFVDPENYVPAGSRVTVWKGKPQQRTAKVISAGTADNSFLAHTHLKLE